MAEAAVTLLMEQVKEVAKQYNNLISGAEYEFEQLCDALIILKAIVKDVGKTKDNLYKELDRQIREVVYEVEDAIDTFLTKEVEAKAKKSRMRSLFSSRNVSLAKAVKSIREDKVLPLLEKAKVRYSLVIADESGSMEDQRPIIIKDVGIRQTRVVVGFEDEEKTITDYLTEEKSGLDVIPIIGIPGQGKTTLAWKIYENGSIIYHFPVRIWICMSQQLNIRDVFLHILRAFSSSQHTSSLKDDELADSVRVCLEKEKFLLVLDDLSSVDAWNAIKEVLPLSNGKGKVLITTRAVDVGTHSRDPHKLKFLTDDESWTLLRHEVFGSQEGSPPELSAIGEQIAIKCDGVPLTIRVIGGILADQLMRSPSASKALQEWEMVLNNVSDALKSDKAQCITDAVALSYHILPHDLRECFVYLGVFPQDYEIPAQMLSSLWISEGFIMPEHGRSLEESAEVKLNDLIVRNLLMLKKTNHMGKAKTCCVPKPIRAFCIAKSGEENLFQEIKRSKMGALEPPVSEEIKSRRLCFHSDPSNFLFENPRCPHVRSFLCFYEQPVELEPEYISAIPDGFPKLRILESKSIKFHKFPAKVTQLIHLRYLTLYIDALSTLPEQISQLWNLQALIVETKSRSITMKANMWRMIQLRYLKTKAALVLDDEWEGEAGQNLHTLNRLAPESCTEAVSRRAINLKTLGVYGELACIFKTNVLEKFNQLEKLKLENSSTYEPIPKDLLQRLHERNCFPTCLKRLTLMSTSLDWEHISALAMITSLEALKLKDNAFVGESWKVSGYNFPSLQFLLIVNTDLLHWEASDDSFPRLRFLVVKNCEKLRELPEILGGNLEKLEIDRVGHSAVESARKIAETKTGKPKGKYGVQFNLTIGAVWEV